VILQIGAGKTCNWIDSQTGRSLDCRHVVHTGYAGAHSIAATHSTSVADSGTTTDSICGTTGGFDIVDNNRRALHANDTNEKDAKET
jgi:hypothetical protein